MPDQATFRAYATFLSTQTPNHPRGPCLFPSIAPRKQSSIVINVIESSTLSTSSIIANTQSASLKSYTIMKLAALRLGLLEVSVDKMCPEELVCRQTQICHLLVCWEIYRQSITSPMPIFRTATHRMLAQQPPPSGTLYGEHHLRKVSPRGSGYSGLSLACGTAPSKSQQRYETSPQLSFETSVASHWSQLFCC